MRRPRHAFVVLIVLGLLGFALPALALASGGGSAGDQQYTDPFGGSGSHTPTHRTTTSAPPPSTSSAPATSSSPPATAPATTAAAPGTAVPTATATSATAASSTSAAGTLPYTGYDGGLAALLGGGLVLSGAALRLRSRRR